MEKYETLFEEALKSDGERYLQIRSEFLAIESDDVKALESKIQDSDWKIRLQAEIFKGWLTEREKYEYIRRVANGTESTLEPEKYMIGKPPVDVSSRTLVELGSAYLPALLEIIYKETDIMTEYAFDVCSEVANVWNDPRANPVFRDLLNNHSVNPAYRESSIQTLFELNDEHLYDNLLKIFKDEKNPLELRSTSIASLGALTDDRVIPFLESILKNPEQDIELRSAAVDGLGATKNPAVIDLLVEQYYTTENDDLKESIIFALGAIEDPKVKKSLKEIQNKESDDGLMEIINETLEDLEDLE
jgi:hypothetical protein